VLFFGLFCYFLGLFSVASHHPGKVFADAIAFIIFYISCCVLFIQYWLLILNAETAIIAIVMTTTKTPTTAIAN